MPGDPFYQSLAWRKTRARILKRDNYRCCVPGCTARAPFVDHIVSRRKGGSDHDHNLRSLCKHHDNEVKELPNGERKNDGRFKGNDITGRPIDPSHPWAKHKFNQ